MIIKEMETNMKKIVHAVPGSQKREAFLSDEAIAREWMGAHYEGSEVARRISEKESSPRSFGRRPNSELAR